MRCDASGRARSGRPGRVSGAGVGCADVVLPHSHGTSVPRGANGVRIGSGGGRRKRGMAGNGGWWISDVGCGRAAFNKPARLRALCGSNPGAGIPRRWGAGAIAGREELTRIHRPAAPALCGSVPGDAPRACCRDRAGRVPSTCVAGRRDGGGRSSFRP